MTKTDIVRSLQKSSETQAFITLQELAKAFGCTEPRSVKKYLTGLEAVNGKYFLITDVAAVIKSQCTMA